MDLTPNLTLGAMILGITEFAKIYLPDNIESKVIPALAVVIGIALGYAQSPGINGIISWLVTALSVTGVYKFTTKVADKVGGNGEQPK